MEKNEKINFHNASFSAAYGTAEQILAFRKKQRTENIERPEIIFSGRSNVGKSSLINKLLNRKSLARISSEPGKTATINYYDIDGKFFLVDLPGYGYAKKSDTEKVRFQKLVNGYFSSDGRISLALQLSDFRRAPTEEDMQMVEFFKTQNIPNIVVFTKSDKLNVTETAKRLEENVTLLPNIKVFEISSLSGKGIPKLKEYIENVILEEFI